MGPNRRALELTLEALHPETFAPVDAARIQLVQSLADAVDMEPTRAALWQQYREALEGLVGGDRDVFADLVAELSAEVRDSSPS